MKDLFKVFHGPDTGSNGGDGSQDLSNEQVANEVEAEETNEAGNGIMIPKSRFDEVNENYKTIKAELDALKGKQSEDEKNAQEQARKDAEEKGEYETLYTNAQAEIATLTQNSETANARIESLEGVINGLLEAKLESIDKDFHDLIPENMTAEQKLAWVSTAESKGIFGNANTSNESLGKKTNGNSSVEVDIEQLSPVQLMMSGYADN